VPRYYFHITDSGLLPDMDGTELDDLDAARAEAVTCLGAIMRDHAAEFWVSGDWRVVVTDAEHVVLFSVSCQGLAAPVPARFYDPRPTVRLDVSGA